MSTSAEVKRNRLAWRGWEPSSLQESSQAVGTYEQFCMQDKVVIQWLRGHLLLLTKEDTSFANTVGIGAKAAEFLYQDGNMDKKTLFGLFWQNVPAGEESKQRTESPVDLIAYFREVVGKEVLGLHAQVVREASQNEGSA